MGRLGRRLSWAHVSWATTLLAQRHKQAQATGQSELDLYENKELAAASKRQLTATRTRYDEMIEHMYRAEKSMDPVLTIFRDNVLFLKHNLNAQAIGSLQDEFSNLEMEIDTLIARMSAAIESSNAFIAEMEK